MSHAWTESDGRLSASMYGVQDDTVHDNMREGPGDPEAVQLTEKVGPPTQSKRAQKSGL